MKQAYEVFTELVEQVLEAQDYSEDVQQTSYDELAMDETLPKELRKFMHNSAEVWQYLIDEGVNVPGVEPVLASSNLFATPEDFSQVTELVNSMPGPEKATAMLAIQMTINYINKG